MIKVTFKTVQQLFTYIGSERVFIDALFVFAENANLGLDDLGKQIVRIKCDYKEYYYAYFDNIQSIEHVKPTDL